jgi:hypothetical protein
VLTDIRRAAAAQPDDTSNRWVKAVVSELEQRTGSTPDNVLPGLRAVVIGPISEEVVFRGCGDLFFHSAIHQPFHSAPFSSIDSLFTPAAPFPSIDSLTCKTNLVPMIVHT